MSKLKVIAGDIEPGVYFVPPGLVGREIVIKWQVTLHQPAEVAADIERVVA